jgi:hypothetical protein
MSIDELKGQKSKNSPMKKLKIENGSKQVNSI